MHQAAKVSASMLLALGAIGSVCSLVRIAYIPEIRSTDHFFSSAVEIAIWSIVEPGIGIFVASLATLRPLFKSLKQTTLKVKSIGSSGKRTFSGQVPGRASLVDRGTVRLHSFESPCSGRQTAEEPKLSDTSMEWQKQRCCPSDVHISGLTMQPSEVRQESV